MRLERLVSLWWGGRLGMWEEIGKYLLSSIEAVAASRNCFVSILVWPRVCSRLRSCIGVEAAGMALRIFECFDFCLSGTFHFQGIARP